jgi:uncharacterized RDD family membrane protein YckC
VTAASPAGFWVRALAFVIDGLVLLFVQASYGSVAALVFGVDPERSWDVSSAVSFFTLVFAALYTTVLHASVGQTVGKMLTRIRVVAADDAPPDGGAAFLRWLGYFVSFATFGFGFLMAGLRPDKRALHDVIAGTRVERVPRVARRDDSVDAPAPPAETSGTREVPVAVPPEPPPA